MSNSQILAEIMTLSRPDQIPFYTHFFRAEKGDICFGDKLLAIKIPELRKVIKKYFKIMKLSDVSEFLESEYNEIRFFGQQVIRAKYQNSKSLDEKSTLISFLLQYRSSINHWNLVDAIAPTIGEYWLETNQFEKFIEYSLEESVWLRRIGIVACFSLINTKSEGYFSTILDVIDNNKLHKHEYIQKAIGWLLRSLGTLDEKVLLGFLKENWNILSSITRSYATEKIRKTIDTKALFGKP